METTPRHLPPRQLSLTEALSAAIESSAKAFAEMSEQMDREWLEREARRKARATEQQRSR